MVEAFPTKELPQDHPLKAFANFELNDGLVIDCHFAERSFAVTVEHLKIGSLAYAVMEEPLTSTELAFPVTLEFLDVREIRVVQQREIGNYRVLRSSLNGLLKALFDVIAIRCVGFGSGTTMFALEFHGRRIIRTPDASYANEISILLECGGVAVQEDLDGRWRELVGSDSLRILHAYRRNPEVLWAANDFHRFVETHLP
ncbi:hypothetical protein EON82_10925 [bacterium]|nr:MAG: hypothetical protein EON82_10925 [bacterium]